MFFKITVAVVIAAILIKAAKRETDSTRNFSWNSDEVNHSTTWAYALGIAALAFIMIAVLIAR